MRGVVSDLEYHRNGLSPIHDDDNKTRYEHALQKYLGHISFHRQWILLDARKFDLYLLTYIVS